MEKELAKLLARLTALKNNLPTSRVEDKYALEFNSILEKLENISGESLSEFKVPLSEIRPVQLSRNMYSSQSYCDRNFLLMKIDGVLGYFTLILQPEGVTNNLGFEVENKN